MCVWRGGQWATPYKAIRSLLLIGGGHATKLWALLSLVTVLWKNRLFSRKRFNPSFRHNNVKVNTVLLLLVFPDEPFRCQVDHYWWRWSSSHLASCLQDLSVTLPLSRPLWRKGFDSGWCAFIGPGLCMCALYMRVCWFPSTIWKSVFTGCFWKQSQVWLPCLHILLSNTAFILMNSFSSLCLPLYSLSAVYTL